MTQQQAACPYFEWKQRVTARGARVTLTHKGKERIGTVVHHYDRVLRVAVDLDRAGRSCARTVTVHARELRPAR